MFEHMIINTIENLFVNHTATVLIAVVIIVGFWTLKGILAGWDNWHTH
jgi:hypothetical protein